MLDHFMRQSQDTPRRTEHGATIIEYVLVLLCMALVVFVGIASLGQKTDSNLQLLESGFNAN